MLPGLAVADLLEGGGFTGVRLVEGALLGEHHLDDFFVGDTRAGAEVLRVVVVPEVAVLGDGDVAVLAYGPVSGSRAVPDGAQQVADFG